MLKVMPGSLETRAEGLLFQCHYLEQPVQCGILDVALRDLLDFHRVKSTQDQAFGVILHEIERLVNAKFSANRFEENGWLIIWPADLLRYGYQERATSAA